MQNEQVIQIDGHKLVALGFNLDKDTVPLIFIHGIIASVNFWTVGQTPYIRENFRWYSLSLPGHYPAAFPAGMQPAQLDAAELARVMAEAVSRLSGGRPAVLVGHSTGGFAALNIASTAPALAHAVASVSGFAQGQWGGILGLQQRLARQGAPGEALFKLNNRALTIHRSLYRRSARFYAHDPRTLLQQPRFRAMIETIFPDYCRLDQDAMLLYFNRMPDIDITPQLGRIQAPVLALAGDKDPIVPPAQAQHIAQHVPEAELRWIPDAGHLPMSEQPAAYDEAIVGWPNGVT